MKIRKLPLMALVVLLTASDCNGELTRTLPRPTAEYRALLQRPTLEGTARGVASAILYSDNQVVVNGTYQNFPGTVKEVALTTTGTSAAWCTLSHTDTAAMQGTFNGTCSFADLVSALNGDRAWVYVFDDPSFDRVLGGLLVKVGR